MSSSKPPINRYLWAMGSAALYIPVGEYVTDRYQVVAPQIWQDMHPELPPDVPQQFGDNILPYLRLYPHRLHLPEVYGVCQLGESVVTLLENVPIDGSGELYPPITSMWTKASAVRQVYWLWQILELWTPLQEVGGGSSLLGPGNLRGEGGGGRLRGWCGGGGRRFRKWGWLLVCWFLKIFGLKGGGYDCENCMWMRLRKMIANWR